MDNRRVEFLSLVARVNEAHSYTISNKIKLNSGTQVRNRPIGSPDKQRVRSQYYVQVDLLGGR